MLRYITPIKRIRSEIAKSECLVTFLKLSLGFGLDFEFGLGLMLGLRVWVRLRDGVTKVICLFLHNLTAALALKLY